jgi:hypothetical protein
MILVELNRMMTNGKYMIMCISILCLAFGCKKPYSPVVISNANNYLVIEGIINTGGDSTIVKLSRTVNLTAAVSSLPELNATVVIQDDQNQSYSLKDNGNGVYVSPILNLDNTRKYRLSITTLDGKIYLSDYVPAVASPPIDSVGFKVVSNGLQIYVNTHDPNNHTHYYRWDYNETWQFHSKYESFYISNGSDVVLRTAAQQIYQCWASDIQTDILLGSSAKLSQDVIYQNPLEVIPPTSEKIESRYSIQVKQYAMTSDSYSYFTQLKKNTEELGSIFDAQPSQLTGNVHCTTDATLPVIGYITAGTIQKKRIYIDEIQLPGSWQPQYPYDCLQDTALYVSKSKPPENQVLQELIPLPNNNIICNPVLSPGSPNPIGYTYSDAECADCSVRGTLIKPSFWQ